MFPSPSRSQNWAQVGQVNRSQIQDQIIFTQDKRKPKQIGHSHTVSLKDLSTWSFTESLSLRIRIYSITPTSHHFYGHIYVALVDNTRAHKINMSPASKPMNISWGKAIVEPGGKIYSTNPDDGLAKLTCKWQGPKLANAIKYTIKFIACTSIKCQLTVNCNFIVWTKSSTESVADH